MNLLRQFRHLSALRLTELALLAGVIMFVAVAPKTFAAAGIYRPINYQGKLSSTGGVALSNGQYNMRFKIFSASAGGVALWTETWNGSSQRVTSTGGLFSIALGSITTMTGSVDFNSDSLYLQVEFDPGNDGVYEEVFTPRRRFASVPYAHNANTLDGLDSTTFIRKDQNETLSGTLLIKPNDSSKTGLEILSSAGVLGTGGLKISTKGASHILFGTGGIYDVQLYRSASGTLKTNAALHVLGMLSGSRLTVSGNANISGALLVSTSITSKGSMSGVTIAGFSLGSCNGSTQKLLYNYATQKFECGSDQTGAGTFGTGNVLTIGDARYVKKSGDTMTGQLVVDITSGNFNTVGLKVINTLSGAHLHAERVLSSSGILTVEGTGFFGTTEISSGIINSNGANMSFRVNNSNILTLGTTSANFAQAIAMDGVTTLSRNSGNGNITFETNANGDIIFDPSGAGDAYLVSGSFGIATSTPRTKLEVAGSISGSTLFVQSMSGAGLTDCDAATSTLRWDQTTQRFSCGSNGGFSTGAVLAIGDARYLKRSGGTMTGVLVVDITSGNFNTVGLKVINTLSGAHLHAERTLTSSGTLTVSAHARFKADVTLGTSVSDAVYVNADFQGSLRPDFETLYDIGAANQRWRSGYFSGVLSGGNLIISNNASISGALLVSTSITSKGSMSGVTIAGFSLGSCNGSTQKLLYNYATQKFECGSDQTGAGTFGTGNVLTIGDARYVKKSGDTMTGQLVVDITSGNFNTVGLKVINTLSGAHLHAERTLTSSGALIVEGAATLLGNVTIGAASTSMIMAGNGTNHAYIQLRGSEDGFGSYGLDYGSALDATRLYTYTGRKLSLGSFTFQRGTYTSRLLIDDAMGYIGIGTVTPKAHLDVIGTLSGSRLSISNNTNISGALLVKGDIVTLGTLISRYGLQFMSGALINELSGFNAGINLPTANLATQGLTRLANNGNLQNIGSIQAGEAHLRTGGTFAAKVDYTTGTNPYSVAIGDLNGDGKADLAVANYLSTSVSVFLNSGSGTFAAKVDYTTGTNASFVAIGDLNGDGKADLAVTNYGSTSVSVFLNNGNGTFAAKVDYTTGSGPSSVKIGDLNGDGKADLAVANDGSTSVSVLLNRGNGTFSAKTDYTAGTNSFSVAIGDLNGDGKADLAVANYGSSLVSVFLNNGNGTFAAKVDYAAGTNAFSVAIGDLNGDGKADLATANYGSTSISVLLNNGNGTFATKVDYAAGTNPYSIAIGDLNGDGKADLASANFGSTSVSVFLNNGNGTFAAKVDYTTGTSPSSVAIGDLNGDGKADLAVANYGSTSVSVLMNNVKTILYASAGTGGSVGIGVATPGARLSVSGTVIISNRGNLSNAVPDAGITLEVSGTISGTSLKLMNDLSMSGALLVSTSITSKGSVSGSSLFGFGLGDCSNTTTSKLIYNNSTGKFSCGSDQTGGASGTFGTGNVLTIGDARYLKRSGGTMTGVLVVDITSGNFNTVGLKVINTLSGAHLHAERLLTSSGMIIGESGALIDSGTFVVDASNNRVGIGTTAPVSPLHIMSAGSLLMRITDTDSASTTTADPYISFRTSDETEIGFIGDGSPSGDIMLMLANTGEVRLTTLASQPISFKTNNTARLTITGGGDVTIGTNASAKARLEVIGTISGARLIVSDNSNMSGALFVLKTLTAKGTLTGQVLHAERDLTSSGLTVLSQQHAIRGSGALVVKQYRNSTGAYITSAATGAALLVLEHTAGSELWTGASLHPSILFGYKGKFDVALWRSADANLNMSGTLALRGGTGRTLLNIVTQSTNAQTNVFKINSEVNTGLGTTHNNLVFRVTASGAVYSDARYNSAGADYAEWFKTPEKDLYPGELVCVDVLQNNTVRKCKRSGDPNLMGIVSSNPSFVGNSIGGADGLIPPGYVLVGLIGQVPAKVILEDGEVIRPGDSLTSGSTPGYARKARAGESTVGVALEAYDGSMTLTTGGAEGVINVLISRRNQSLTVETVEQKVLDSIASMNLSDEIQQMVQSVSQNLNLDDRVTAALNSHIQSIDLSEQINMAIDARLSGATLSAENLSPQQIALIASAVHALATETGTTVADTQSRALIEALAARVLQLETAFSGSVLHAAVADIGTLSVRGTASFGSGITVVGSSAIGPMTISDSDVQIGSLMATGSLKVMGPITVAGLATFLGDVDVQGELMLSSRQAGFAVIAKTSTSVTVLFEIPLSAEPAVNATPQSRVGSDWWIQNSSMTGFTIQMADLAGTDVRFSWTAISSRTAATTHGSAAEPVSDPIPFPVNSLGQPVSSDPVWNGCIQGYPLLDADGHPLSCARYHSDFTWEQPDLHISFTYNPNHEPPILLLPPGYKATVISDVEDDAESESETEDPPSGEESVAEPEPESEPEPEPEPEPESPSESDSEESSDIPAESEDPAPPSDDASVGPEESDDSATEEAPPTTESADPAPPPTAEQE